MPRKAKTHDRADGMTQISLSLPQRLVDRIDELAEIDNRNRSNFIATYLEKIAKENEKSAKK